MYSNVLIWFLEGWAISRADLDIKNKIGQGEFGGEITWFVWQVTWSHFTPLRGVDGWVQRQESRYQKYEGDKECSRNTTVSGRGFHHDVRLSHFPLLLFCSLPFSSTLQHNNLVGLIGVSLDESPIYLVTEFMEKGSLVEYLQSKRRAVISKVNLLTFSRWGRSDSSLMVSLMLFSADTSVMEWYI